MKRNPLIPFALIATLGIIFMITLASYGGNQLQDRLAEKGQGAEEKTNLASQPAEKIYKNNCATCHGAKLEGGMGPSLKNLKLSKKEVLAQIKNGGGGMPPGIIKGKAAEKVATWLLKQ